MPAGNSKNTYGGLFLFPKKFRRKISPATLTYNNYIFDFIECLEVQLSGTENNCKILKINFVLNPFKLKWYLYFINPFSPSVTFHIETRHLICSVKQMTGFYIKHNFGMKWATHN